MEEQPRKRLGRPRKSVDVPNAIEEGADALNDNAGNGQVGAVGDSASTVNVQQGEDWGSFLLRVDGCRNPFLRNVFHPNPQASVIIRDNGNLNVFVGEIKGQLNTSDFIEI